VFNSYSLLFFNFFLLNNWSTRNLSFRIDINFFFFFYLIQVNMPADSFESPLTLAACGGHVELASLLIERGANLEEVNDEGYTPLMEAAREGHEEMVALLLAHGKLFNYIFHKK
jgi:ankyrin repeat protein